MTPLIDFLTINQTVGAVIFAIGGVALGLWLAAAWWAYADLSRRVELELVRLAAPVWILAATPVFLPFSLATYLLVRPQLMVAERRSRRILEALAPSLADASCPGCGSSVDAAWRRCPSCAAWLAAPCSRCGSWSPIELKICPFCATDWSPDTDTTDVVRGFVPVMVQSGAPSPGVAPAAVAPAAVAPVFSPEPIAAAFTPLVASLGVDISRPLAGISPRNREARVDGRTDRATSGSDPRLARIGR